MIDLNDMNGAQRKAVTQSGGPLLLLAGPGSGKTFTVTRRILYLLEKGVPPERILVITFTREAAESMQRRFLELSDTFHPVHFGTFHSVFYQMLKQSHVLKSTKLLTDSDKKKLILPILQKHSGETDGKKPKDGLREDAGILLAAVSYYKNTLRAEEAAQKVPAQWREEFAGILRDYQNAVKACGRLDFDDMISECRRLLLEDAGFRAAWQGRFSHILIDEFQDINPMQYEVIKLIAGDSAVLFAVGDDDQSIYGFRGSEPECLRRFEREYHAQRLLLDVNYRSHPQIVEASLAVIGENRDRFVKALRSARQEDTADAAETGRVRLLSFPGREEEYAYLAGRLRKFLSDGEDGDRRECAVLFRTNSYMQRLAVRLRAAGIPFVMGERMQSVYEHFIAKDVTAYLTLASGDWNREDLLRVVNRPSRFVSREAVGDKGRSMGELIAYYKEMTDSSDKSARSILESLRKFERQLQVMRGLSPGLAVAYVQKAAGYGDYLRSLAGPNAERLAQWLEILEWLKADAARFPGVKEWKAAQEEHTEALSHRKEGAGREKRPESQGGPVIRLMTAHGAKGLEFDTVILADCNETVFPHGRLQGEAQVEEERRVFYVAMTRAKENLELLYLTESGERPRLPSRFLQPLLRNYSSISSSNSQLSKYSSKASATFSYSSSSSI